MGKNKSDPKIFKSFSKPARPGEIATVPDEDETPHTTTTLFRGRSVRVSDIKKRTDILDAMLEKAERDERATYVALVRMAATFQSTAMRKGPAASAKKRGDRAGTPEQRKEFINAAKDEWESEGYEGKKKSTKEDMVKHLLVSNKGMRPAITTAAGWLKGINKAAYRRGKAKRQK